MPDNEKKLLVELAALPKPVRDDFMSQITGAATAVRVMTAAVTKDAAEAQDPPRG